MIGGLSEQARADTLGKRVRQKGITIAALAEVSATKEIGRGGAARKALAHLVSGSQVLSLLDQGIISGTNFLALVMIGAWTDVGQLGVYGIGLSVFMVLLAVQDSLITRPYSIHLHDTIGTHTEDAIASAVLSLGLSAVAALIMYATAITFVAVAVTIEVVHITLVLATAAPFVLAREFARRLAFAQLRVVDALRIDVAVSVLTILGLSALGHAGWLSAVTALMATGVSSAVVTAVLLYLTRREFVFQANSVRVIAQRSWAVGKWLLSSQLAMQAQGYVTPWLTMVLIGPAATGVYVVCASIVGFANPILFGFFNILVPKSAHALHAGGLGGLRRQALYDTLPLAMAMLAFCAFIFAAGDDVTGLLFRGAEHKGYGYILSVLAVASVVAAIGAPASIAVAQLKRTRALAGLMLVNVILSVGLIGLLLPRWGLEGAAYGVLISELFGSIGRWLIFLLPVPNTKKRSQP